MSLPPLSKKLAEKLIQLDHDFAWTINEMGALMTDDEVDYCDKNDLLYQQPTEIGGLVMLTSRSRKILFNKSHDPISLTRRSDKAYLRLCLLELEFVPTRGVRDYTELAPNNGFVQCDTPEGVALVTGHLSNGGMTRHGMLSLINRLRSSALAYGFKVIILTPNARRGHGLATSNALFFRVIPYLPNQVSEADELGEVRLKVLDRERTRASDTPSITGSEAERRKVLGVPDLTLDILQMVRAERIDRARADLDVDTVMTLTQLEKYYDLKAADLNGVLSIEEIVRPVHGRTSEAVDVTFLLGSQRFSRLSAPALGHRAGTTELRHQLGAEAKRETWQVEKRGRLSA